MKIVPEAGSIKTAGSERIVPLHPAIIEAGFLQYVSSLRSGPIFPALPPDRFGKRGGNGTKVIGQWVRRLGLTDKRVSPSHSWRHRFKTLSRRHELMADIVNAITGHHRKTVADMGVARIVATRPLGAEKLFSAANSHTRYGRNLLKY
jgi:integrase